MPPTYAQNKIHIYNYVSKNREKHNEYNKEWRTNNLEEYNLNRRTKYELLKIPFNNEWKRLCSIKI